MVYEIYTEGVCIPDVGGFAFKCFDEAGEVWREGSGWMEDTTINRMDLYAIIHSHKKIGIEIEEDYVRIIQKPETLTFPADNDGIAVEQLFFDITYEINDHMFRPTVMTEHSAFGTFCFTSCNSGNVTGAGIDLQTNIRMLEGFIGIGSAAHSWFDMITLPAESRVSYLHIQSNASDRRKNKGIPVMVNFPVSSGSRLSGLTLQQKLYKMLSVCLKHNFCLMMVVLKNCQGDYASNPGRTKARAAGNTTSSDRRSLSRCIRIESVLSSCAGYSA